MKQIRLVLLSDVVAAVVVGVGVSPLVRGKTPRRGGGSLGIAGVALLLGQVDVGGPARRILLATS
jgi:hypothetical protein